MKAFEILDRGGFEVRVIGLITDQVIAALKGGTEAGTFISLEEARDAVGRVCNAHRGDDIPLTVPPQLCPPALRSLPLRAWMRSSVPGPEGRVVSSRRTPAKARSAG